MRRDARVSVLNGCGSRPTGRASAAAPVWRAAGRGSGGAAAHGGRAMSRSPGTGILRQTLWKRRRKAGVLGRGGLEHAQLSRT